MAWGTILSSASSNYILESQLVLSALYCGGELELVSNHYFPNKLQQAILLFRCYPTVLDLHCGLIRDRELSWGDIARTTTPLSLLQRLVNVAIINKMERFAWWRYSQPGRQDLFTTRPKLLQHDKLGYCRTIQQGYCFSPILHRETL